MNPGPEMNLAVAEAAGMQPRMGTKCKSRFGGRSSEDYCDVCLVDTKPDSAPVPAVAGVRRFYPSTEWNDAMEAAEKVGLFHPSLGCGKLEQSMGEDGTEWCMSWFENGKEIEVYAESGPVAICKAILASRKGELNG